MDGLDRRYFVLFSLIEYSLCVRYGVNCRMCVYLVYYFSL